MARVGAPRLRFPRFPGDGNRGTNAREALGTGGVALVPGGRIPLGGRWRPLRVQGLGIEVPGALVHTGRDSLAAPSRTTALARQSTAYHYVPARSVASLDVRFYPSKLARVDPTNIKHSPPGQNRRATWRPIRSRNSRTVPSYPTFEKYPLRIQSTQKSRGARHLHQELW